MVRSCCSGRPRSAAHESSPPVKSEVPPSPWPGDRHSPQLTYDLRLDVPLVVLGYVTWSTLQALDDKLDPSHCHWCDDDLNAVDRKTRDALKWPEEHQETALVLSDISANALAPAATVGVSAIIAAYDDRFAEVPIDIVVTGEAVALAGIITQVVKFSAGRMRPETRALRPKSDPPASRATPTSRSTPATRAMRSRSPRPRAPSLPCASIEAQSGSG